MKSKKVKINLFNLSILFLPVVLSITVACTRKTQVPTLMAAGQRIQLSTLDTDKPSANRQMATKTTSVSAIMTLAKAAILGQEFIYGADLQHSSQYDKSMDLYNQSLVVVHWPATFVINGNELQLIASDTDKYPSDVNHPAQLISRYTIVSQDDASITVNAADSSRFLALQINTPDLSGDPAIAKPINILDTWTRSLEYVPTGNYLLEESSIQMADGTISEVMESIFPRTTIAPGKDFKKFKMSTTEPSGAAPDSPSEVSRFRFLQGDTVFTGEDKHAWAQHFDLSPKADGKPATIDWYATANIPDEYLEPVKEAVEGWNRYFRNYEGFKRDVVLFKGRLPQGVHLGDPRYNVINWDSRLVAGAAYESQGSDPETGVQSHSLIYMPAAWVAIGTKYWSQGFDSQASDATATVATTNYTKSLLQRRVNCSRDLQEVAQIAASGRLPADQIKVFGIQTLKQTLFHEVGHSLGLAHNFKGSLSWDPSKANSIFSTSIMDYNDYEVERAAFSDVHSADGPQLEYDRQAISAIYDNSKDIRSGDAVLTACADAEADNQNGGVDPLCIRYDNETDPTQSVSDAYTRITSPTATNDISLTQALSRIPALSLPYDHVASLLKADDVKTAANNLAAQIKGSLSFYIVTGKMSLDYETRLNVKSLYQFADGVLPSGYNERAMRERAFAGIMNSINFLALPDGVKKAASDAIDDVIQRLSGSPGMKQMNASDTQQTKTDLKNSMEKTVASFEGDASAGLVKLRLAVIGTLTLQKSVSYYFGTLDSAQLDYETSAVGLLTDVVSKSDTRHVPQERILAAQALKTFSKRMTGEQAIATLRPILLLERSRANSNDSRDTIEQILTALNLN